MWADEALNRPFHPVMPVVHLAVVYAKGHNGRLAVFVRIPLVEYVSNRGFQRLKCFLPLSWSLV